MASIKINIGYPLYNGSEAIFIAPCDCSSITGLRIYHPISKLNTTQTSTKFVFKDAHGGDLSNVDNLFKTGAYVKVILNVTDKIAYIQNADTNSYLEGKINNLLYIESFDKTTGILKTKSYDGK